MCSNQSDSGFGPEDITGDLKPGDWKTKYPEKEAQNAILLETCYVVFLLFLCPILMYLIWCQYFQSILALDDNQYRILSKYLYAWVGGMFGGTLFDLKWLYHSVAHTKWRRDRRLWRLLSPHLSAGLSFSFVVLICSNFITVFDSTSMDSAAAIIAISFLVGYFSDSALAKMSDVALSVFGSASRRT